MKEKLKPLYANVAMAAMAAWAWIKQAAPKVWAWLKARPKLLAFLAIAVALVVLALVVGRQAPAGAGQQAAVVQPQSDPPEQHLQLQIDQLAGRMQAMEGVVADLVARLSYRPAPTAQRSAPAAVAVAWKKPTELERRLADFQRLIDASPTFNTNQKEIAK